MAEGKRDLKHVKIDSLSKDGSIGSIETVSSNAYCPILKHIKISFFQFQYHGFVIVLLATFCVDLSTQLQNETSFARDGKGKTTKTYMTSIKVGRYYMG